MKKNLLHRMLIREIIKHRMQFVMLTVLCALGSFSYVGLDETGKMVRETIDQYFEEKNLADFWITVPQADRRYMEKIREISGISELCARAEADADAGMDRQLRVVCYDGEMEINSPYLLSGELLSPKDRRGCLLDSRFAERHGLKPGDTLSLQIGGERIRLVIRGTVMSPEFVYLVQGTAPAPETYGFLLANSCAFPKLPLSQIVVCIEKEADKDIVLRTLLERLPEAQIIERGTHISTKNIENEARVYTQIRYIFPVLAYFLAVFVMVTTLGRMIYNQRLEIGLLEAIGFEKAQIRRHYLSYALLPSLTGAAIGASMGYVVLPNIFWRGILRQRNLPYRIMPRLSAGAGASVLMTVLFSLIFYHLVYRRVVKESVALLMRPKPPEKGKHVLLEKVEWIWSRLSVNSKLVFRNLTRRRLRAVMTMMAALFCNMLLITAVGLQDTIRSLVKTHYVEAMRWDAEVLLNEHAGKPESYEGRIHADMVECEMVKSVSVRAGDRMRIVPLTVLNNDQRMQYLGKNASFVELPEKEAAITWKLGEVMGIKAGDVVKVYFPGRETPVSLQVGMMVDNIMSQGIYLTRFAWEKLRMGGFIPTAIHLSGLQEGCLEEIDRMEETERIEWPQTQMQELLEVLDFLSVIFKLMGAVALLLNFVISHNIGLINYAERVREYAMMKIQGIYQHEIWYQIFMENFLLTVPGMLLGIYPGMVLTDVIIRSCESETERYYGIVPLQTIAFSCAVTLVFSLLIQFLITRKIRKMSAVKILQSPE